MKKNERLNELLGNLLQEINWENYPQVDEEDEWKAWQVIWNTAEGLIESEDLSEEVIDFLELIQNFVCPILNEIENESKH